MSERLTKWFPASVTPAHVGVYEVMDDDGETGWYAFWNGFKFGYRCWKSPQSARDQWREKTGLPARTYWRGLAENPEK